MPHYTTKQRKQKAVLWERTGYDDRGRPIIGEPVELDVRWEESRESVTSRDGTDLALDSRVVVDREIKENSIMWKGSLEQWLGGVTVGDGDNPGSAGDDTKLLEVAIYNEVPTLNGRKVFREVGLKYFGDQLPISG